MAKFDLKEYARRGAEARAAELQAELAEIYRAFPGLRAGGRRGRGSRTAAAASDSAAAPARRRRRRKVSAEERKAISLRMKRYWAARRKEKA